MLSGVSTVSGEEGRLRIYIPSDVSKDSAFPFEKGDEITIRIDKESDRVILER